MTLELKAMIRKIETFRTSLPDKLKIMQRFYDAVFSAGMRAGEIARSEKFATMNFAYDKSADVLYVTIGESAPEECKFAENANGDILRIHRQTEEIVGVTIISFFSRSQKGAIEVLPLPAAPEDKK